MTELIGMSLSPWSEKAKWALDHHHIPYRYHEHLILFGMPALHLKTREFRRELTLPILLDGREKFFDSFDIAEHADRKGAASKLFPPDRLDEIRRFNEQSEKALDAGRGLIVSKIRNHPGALKESMPPFMRAFSGLMLPLAVLGVKYISSAFGSKNRAIAVHYETLFETLVTLRKNLKAAGGKYLLGDFSFADVTMAVTLHFVKPADSPYIRFGPASRACWTDENLASEFSDLIAWRDELYRKHRSLPERRA